MPGYTTPAWQTLPLTAGAAATFNGESTAAPGDVADIQRLIDEAIGAAH